MIIYKIASAEMDFNYDVFAFLVNKLGYEKGPPLCDDIRVEVQKMGIPFRFEEIYASGMAKNDVCIISSRALRLDVVAFMSVLFHELAHFYQYKKYGNDFALPIYTDSPKNIEQNCEMLRKIEMTADRFSRYKTDFYAKKYNLPPGLRVNYGVVSCQFFKGHILRIKKMVKDKKLNTIQEINEEIYNSIKMG